MKLGKKHAIRDGRTLPVKRYVRGAVPLEADWMAGIRRWPMLGNDDVGCCTCAAFGHALAGQSAAADGVSKRIKPNVRTVLRAYSGLTGYNPTTGAHDDGAVMLDALKYFRESGLGRDRLGAFGYVSAHTPEHLFAAIWAFGGVYAGFMLPEAIQSLEDYWYTPIVESWRSGDWEPGSLGGHAMYLGGYDARLGVVYGVSWGRRVTLSMAFVQAYCDEAYALASEAWTNDLGRAPSGLDMERMLQDLRNLKRPAA